MTQSRGLEQSGTQCKGAGGAQSGAQSTALSESLGLHSLKEVAPPPQNNRKTPQQDLPPKEPQHAAMQHPPRKGRPPPQQAPTRDRPSHHPTPQKGVLPDIAALQRAGAPVPGNLTNDAPNGGAGLLQEPDGMTRQAYAAAAGDDTPSGPEPELPPYTGNKIIFLDLSNNQLVGGATCAPWSGRADFGRAPGGLRGPFSSLGRGALAGAAALLSAWLGRVGGLPRVLPPFLSGSPTPQPHPECHPLTHRPPNPTQRLRTPARPPARPIPPKPCPPTPARPLPTHSTPARPPVPKTPPDRRHTPRAVAPRRVPLHHGRAAVSRTAG